MSDTATSTVAAHGHGLSQKQIMSIVGLVPLGAYVIAHLWTNLYSLGGPEAFDAALAASRSSPVFVFLEFLLGLAIAYHAWVGAKIVHQMRSNGVRYDYFRNWKYILQRISGVGVLLFIGAHVVKARLMPAMAGSVETWQGMHEALSEWPTITVYALGLGGIAYHLANGVWGSALTLGLAVTPAAQRRVEWASWFVFFLLIAMATLAVYGFHPFDIDFFRR